MAALLMTCGAQQTVAGDLRYIAADTLTLVGKAMPGGCHWHRVDTAKYAALPQKVKNLFRTPAGLAVCFTTDSKTIAARWELKKKKYNATSIATNIAKRSDFIKHPATFFNIMTATIIAIIQKT